MNGNISSVVFTWTLDIPCWILDIEYLAVLLDIGYSPALRDPAGRDGILDIEYLAVLLDIGYSPAGLDIGY